MEFVFFMILVIWTTPSWGLLFDENDWSVGCFESCLPLPQTNWRWPRAKIQRKYIMLSYVNIPTNRFVCYKRACRQTHDNNSKQHVINGCQIQRGRAREQGSDAEGIISLIHTPVYSTGSGGGWCLIFWRRLCVVLAFGSVQRREGSEMDWCRMLLLNV